MAIGITGGTEIMGRTMGNSFSADQQRPVSKEVDWRAHLPEGYGDKKYGRLQSFFHVLQTIGSHASRLLPKNRQKVSASIPKLTLQQGDESSTTFGIKKQVAAQREQTLLNRIRSLHVMNLPSKPGDSIHSMLATQPSMAAIKSGATTFYDSPHASAWRMFREAQARGSITPSLSFNEWQNLQETTPMKAIGEEYATTPQKEGVHDMPTLTRMPVIASRFDADEAILPDATEANTATFESDATVPTLRARIRAIKATVRLINALGSRQPAAA